MPRYFFHVHCASRVKPDWLGRELPSLNDALAYAEEARLEIMLEDAVENLWFDITDQSGNLVATVPVRSAAHSG